MPGPLAAWWRHLPAVGQDLIVGVLVIVGRTAATLAVQLPPAAETRFVGRRKGKDLDVEQVLAVRHLLTPTGFRPGVEEMEANSADPSHVSMSEPDATGGLLSQRTAGPSGSGVTRAGGPLGRGIRGRSAAFAMTTGAGERDHLGSPSPPGSAPT